MYQNLVDFIPAVGGPGLTTLEDNKKRNLGIDPNQPGDPGNYTPKPEGTPGYGGVPNPSAPPATPSVPTPDGSFASLVSPAKQSPPTPGAISQVATPANTPGVIPNTPSYRPAFLGAEGERGIQAQQESARQTFGAYEAALQAKLNQRNQEATIKAQEAAANKGYGDAMSQEKLRNAQAATAGIQADTRKKEYDYEYGKAKFPVEDVLKQKQEEAAAVAKAKADADKAKGIAGRLADIEKSTAKVPQENWNPFNSYGTAGQLWSAAKNILPKYPSPFGVTLPGVANDPGKALDAITGAYKYWTK